MLDLTAGYVAAGVTPLFLALAMLRAVLGVAYAFLGHA
jgi:hypothetical protein